MTQDKARKAAVRARMAQTGESYTEADRQLADPVSPQDVLDGALREFGIPVGALSLVLRHLRETSEYPLLAASAVDRLKIYLDLKDWVALAKARLGRPEFPHDRAAYEALRAAVASGQVIVLLSGVTYQELSRIGSLRQRTDLADVIAEISGFATITGRSVATRHQVLTALAARYGGPEPAPIRPLGIGINNVAPGAINTPINKALLENKPELDALLRNIPLGRLGSVDDVAAMVAFLACDEASYVTGSTFVADGGLIRNYREQ